MNAAVEASLLQLKDVAERAGYCRGLRRVWRELQEANAATPVVRAIMDKLLAELEVP